MPFHDARDARECVFVCLCWAEFRFITCYYSWNERSDATRRTGAAPATWIVVLVADICKAIQFVKAAETEATGGWSVVVFFSFIGKWSVNGY